MTRSESIAAYSHSQKNFSPQRRRRAGRVVDAVDLEEA